MPNAHTFQKDGHLCWFHDEGSDAGFFHTYDALNPGSSETPRRLHVFLPREYEHEKTRYKTLYMNDGNTVFFPGGIGNRSWRLDEVLSGLYARGTLAEKIIVVAVCPIDRNEEYTHRPWHGSGCCGLDDYSRYLATSLKPFIDANYRTQSDAAMIAGSSHGGLAAFYTAMRHAPAFEMAACLSPSFWVGVDDAERFPEVRENPTGRAESALPELGAWLATVRRLPRLYFDWGMVRTGGCHNSHIERLSAIRTMEIIRFLLERNYRYGWNLSFNEIPDGEHTETSWRERFDRVISLWVNRK